VGRRRVHQTLRVLLASGLASIVLVVMPGTQAHADPSVSEIEAQISTVWNQLEPLIEEYNGVHDQYQKNKAQQEDLTNKLAPLQKELDLGQVRIGAMAAEVYMGGQAGMLNALIQSGSPATVASQLSYLDQITRDQETQLSGVSSLKAQYDAQKAPVDALVAQLSTQDADLATKKTQIESQLADLQKLRQKAYGTGGSTGSYRPWPCPATYEPTKGYKAAQVACAQAGKPYVWAAAGPNSYDCSGLVMAAWQTQGVYLPHQSQSQRSATVRIARSDLQIGDLVFYFSPIHHVAIYVGDGKIMQAPFAGDNVRMSLLDAPGSVNSYGRVS
jgi:cell wall-associated NlpC family hydrolase